MDERVGKLINKLKKEDLYDLAEIVINRVNNSKLLEKINIALKDGIGFLDIAKQVLRRPFCRPF